jgi:microcystin-dependent protein
MPNFIFKRLSKYAQALTTPWTGVVPFSVGSETKIVSFAQLRSDILASAQLTGAPTAPTPNSTDDSERLATTEFVQQLLTGVGAAPADSNNYGTVRTNSPSGGAPVVYLKAEVDALVQAAIAAAVPPGSIKTFAGATAPSGFLLCDGSSVSRLTYAALFAAIGTTYGSANSTVFTLPDLRGRSPIGVGQMPGGTARSLGASGGAETHALTALESSYTHSHNSPTGEKFAVVPDSGSTGEFLIQVYTGINDTGSRLPINRRTATAALTGFGNPHNNMQPFLALNHIIKF